MKFDKYIGCDLHQATTEVFILTAPFIEPRCRRLALQFRAGIHFSRYRLTRGRFECNRSGADTRSLPCGTLHLPKSADQFRGDTIR
jgi:hypothetical protein